MRSEKLQEYKEAINCGRKFLQYWCIDQFKQIVGGNQIDLTKEDIALLHTGQLYLLDRADNEGIDIDEVELYGLVETYYSENPIVQIESFVDDDGRTVRFAIPESNQSITRKALLYETDEQHEIYNVTPRLAQLHLLYRLNVTRLKEQRYDLEKPFACGMIPRPIVDLNNLKNTCLNHSWLLWQVSDLSEFCLVDEVKVLLKKIIEWLGYELYKFSDFGFLTIAGILYTIARIGEQKKYEKLCSAISSYLYHNQNDRNKNWEEHGAGAILNTALVVNAFNLMKEKPRFVAMARDWLMREVDTENVESKFWKQDLLSKTGVGFDVWTTCQVLKALEGGLISRENPLTEEDFYENMKFRFNNKWHIHFGGNNSITFNGIPVPLTLSNYRLLFLLAVNLFEQPNSEGWLNVRKLDSDVRADSNASQNITFLRKELDRKTEDLIDRMKLIERNKDVSGEYRLSSHRRYISFDLKVIANNQDRFIKEKWRLLEECKGEMYPFV